MDRYTVVDTKWIALDINHLIILEDSKIMLYSYDELKINNSWTLFHDEKSLLCISEYEVLDFIQLKKTIKEKDDCIYKVATSDKLNWLIFYKNHITHLEIKQGELRKQISGINFYKFNDLNILDDHIEIKDKNIVIYDYEVEIIRDLKYTYES